MLRIPIYIRSLRPKRHLLVLFGLIALIAVGCRNRVDDVSDSWNQVSSILARIQPPKFPNRDFAVTTYGATADGSTDCTEAIRKAVDACAAAGGGRVVVPEGEYLTGPIHLKSNVNVHLEDGATLMFHRDPTKYLPLVFTRWEGVELMNYSPLIYAFGQENIAVTGKGTLDGRAGADHWWSWKGNKEHGWIEGMPNQRAGRARLFEMGEKGVPVEDRKFGEGYYLRPSFLQPYKCKNVLIEGVTIINSPMWEIHPVLCENVTVRDLVIDTHGPNNDGVNPESCSDVLIENSFFNTGDDCIAIKSGRNNDGRRVNVPSQNIVIRGCTFRDGHGAVTIGSEISGGARNIFAEDCEVESPILYNALRIKSNAVRGGTIENINVRRFAVQLVERAAIDIDLYYEEGKKGSFFPTIRNIVVERMRVEKCAVAFNLVGYEEAPIRNVRLTDCQFKNVQKGYTVSYVTGFNVHQTTVNGNEIQPASATQ